MRLAFAGTPEFAATALAALIAAGHDIALVLTQPDRPAGRGMKLQSSPVKLLAARRGLPLAQPRSLRPDGKFPDDARSARRALEEAAPEALVVAAYGLILPEWVLALPPRGCLNIHASLLPRWRGAAPIHRAIEAGDRETGITIMQMDAGLDTGDIVLLERAQIAGDDTTATLQHRLAELGGRAIVRALAHPDLPRTPQQREGVTYAQKIGKAEAAIDWSQPAAVLERRVRAFDPFPGASFHRAGETIKLWRASVVDVATEASGPAETGAGEAGRVLAAQPDRLVVACGHGALALEQLQYPGGRRLDAAAFLRSHPLVAGEVL